MFMRVGAGECVLILVLLLVVFLLAVISVWTLNKS
jgi:hypothetical protein